MEYSRKSKNIYNCVRESLEYVKEISQVTGTSGILNKQYWDNCTAIWDKDVFRSILTYM